MDFWSRLIGGVSGASQSKKTATNNPQQRLARFKRIYSQTLQSWHQSSIKAEQPSAQSVLSGLQRLTSILQDDTRAPAPHLCLSFAASSYVYTAITRIALSLQSEAIVTQAVTIFSVLVDSDEESLVGTDRFAEALTDFIEKTLTGQVAHLAESTQCDILELAFGIIAKIRLDPDLLFTWFRSPKRKQDGDTNESRPPGYTIDFPLCHQLVKFVHYEGRAGDFARTGVLYLFDVTSQSIDLETWLTGSEVPTLIASGLGALYSSLSRKLTIQRPEASLPLILALSEPLEASVTADSESFYSPDLQARLSTFMSYFVFWQDILDHCQAAEMKDTLVDHFQIFFLQQILYPSLLESSDVDGGSSVAVLMYLWRILDSVTHPDLIHRILRYLLALTQSLNPVPVALPDPAPENRRKSYFAVSNSMDEEANMNPSFFNLVDLIVTSIQSSNSQTAIAALRLTTTIVSKHHTYAISSLIKSTPHPSSANRQTSGESLQNTEDFCGLVEEIGALEGVDEAYETCLKDAMNLVETHVCSTHKLNSQLRRMDGKKHDTRTDAEGPTFQEHQLRVEDPFLQALLGLLQTLLTNDIEVNLNLTSVLTHLASCPYTRLEGWLVSIRSDAPVSKEEAMSPAPLDEPSTDVLENGYFTAQPDEPSEAEEEAARLDAYRKSRIRSHVSYDTASPVLRILRNLVAEVTALEPSVPDFRTYLSGRKRAFLGAYELENPDISVSNTPSILTPVKNQSRAPSSTRGTPATPSAVLTPQPIKRGTLIQEAIANSPRGRALTAIVSGGSPARSALARSPEKKERGRRPAPLASTPGSGGASASASPSPGPGQGLQPRNDRHSSRSPSKLSRALSPSWFRPPEDEEQPRTPVRAGPRSPGSLVSPEPETEIFERKIRFAPGRKPVLVGVESGGFKLGGAAAAGGDDVADAAQEADGDAAEDGLVREATFSHVLTNAVILQEFLLELAAIMQVRAGLLDGEVAFV